MTFYRYRKNAAEEDSALKFPQLGFSGAKLKLIQEIPYTCHLDTILPSLIFGLRNVHAVLCHLFRCFDPSFKENIHCHPVFIIRDINSCRKGYLKDRLKSGESDHSAILNLDVEKSAVTPFNSATTSCIASRIVRLNVDKNSGMICGGFCKKSVSYNTYSSDSSSRVLNGFVSSCFDKC